MDESLSPVKPVKQSQLRGAKALSTEKSNKETLVQREGHKSASRSKENSTTAKDEHNIGSQVSRGQGKTSTDTPQDKRRGRPSRLSRLTGRTGSGERGKGKGASLQQHLVPQASESRTSLSADSSPSANKESSSSVVPVTPDKGLTEQARSSTRALAKEKSQVLKAATLMHQSVQEGPEVRPTVEEGPLTEQQLGLRQAEERLRRDYIYRLLKQSPEYPNYQYICKLCSVHIENIQGAHKHIKEKRHKKNIMEKQEENELRALPPPSAAQLWAVNAAVLETARQQGISDEDFEIRKTVVSRMEIIIQKHLTACSLRLYGSCLTRFAFKTSDINIDVTYPPSMTQPEVLIQVLEILKNSPEFSEVESDFHAKVPIVFCRDVSSGLMCKVSAGNDVACLTTNHLAALSKLEPRLISLVLAFRYWARLCHIDCQAEGGIPSYSFALMVIFFLQQRKDPILPVYLGPWIEGFDVKHVDEYHLTGITMDMYVQWEHRPPTSTEGRGENRNEARGEGRAKPQHRNDAPNSEGLIRLTFNVGKDVALGQLWLELLRFYTLEFALEEYIISIRLKDLLSREVKNWPRRRLAIEDPFALKRNVARSLNSQMVFEYIQERFRTAYKYFACPQKKGTGGHQTKKKARAQGVKLEEAGKKEPSSTNKDENNIKAEKSQSVQRGHQGSKEDEEPDSDDEDGSDPSKERNESTLDTRLMDMLLSEGNTLSSSPNGLLDSDREEEEEEEDNGVSEDDGPVAPDDLHYVFDKMIFTCGKPPTVVCSICKRDGHLKDECPEDFKKIELKPLPPMNDRFREILDGLCKLCYYELSPTHAEQQRREQILASLERFIRKEYNEKAQLCLFGSSKNGFGFRDSDLDICMTLEGHETAEKLNCKEIIEGLAKVLKKHTGLRNILPITTAKVPIVKFEHKQSGLEGDISLYNTLAQHNTRMLATYAALDPRVQFLGYTMKVFAKRCDIGDASRGSLSSYAYILMVLYFLQQRQPPVIPVLQEIFDGNTVPQRLVDGWNAFFFDDLEDLRRHHLENQQNTESVGELWLGLLRFYTEEFDFKEHVISIRQRKRLTTFEKQWTSKCIAIEDPFDLNHNLGAGVSRKMTNFIMKAFINGRKLFGTPFYPVPGTEVEYFFDSKVLTDGELAPNDRCCRICGKIGHYMKDCPKRRRIKKKENEKDEDIKEEEREPKDRRCFQCGDMGHVRRDCPEYRHLKQRAAGAPASHMVRTIVSSQSIPIPQTAADCPGRTRQASECSDSRQTPPYSPQPTAVPPSSTHSSSTQPSHTKTNSAGPHKQSAHPQVPLSLLSFPTSHPGQYHPGALTALGLLPTHQHQSHQSQGQSTHPVHLPSTSWPIHGPVLTSSSPTAPSPPGMKFALRSASGNGSPTGSGGNPSTMNLNDPSIIFAQPAGRQLGISGPGREGHWHNHLAQPGSLMGNGTVVKSESGHPASFVAVSQGSRLWEHNKTPQYTLSPSWPYRMPQNFIQQGNGGYQHGKPFVAQGSMMHPNPNFPLVPHVRHPVNLNFIQQKK
ncbi:terminal uridylyltransferase 4 isoform X1 [Simochromis diagramma]|uniref:terminal uridylyltransferase 4 isoform X1 n=1 Tax=Simochromis diagramma TaxID=43689 RepID=UPI001A7E5AF5|nr:terminal uridylyltransferase 4 isoform X1 [Simochromis diagramma]XP_039860018.1 terminal uridylyltransferase 4 isoform X1 [Simochromis diagramma]XP_039860020.1 terminal uridylyltransferase 4 isoform X1 [Simochromis diagramma]